MNIYTEFNSVGCTFLHHRILRIQTNNEVQNPLTRRVNNNKIVKNNTTSVPLILIYFLFRYYRIIITNQDIFNTYTYC